ncbi:Zinc finger BED domain-containing protein DAYSLEEPER [Rhynchospora pubera]|uniref:Zinc finger BED domain-containing protein DAYSLEEPER n=1 Tax=Rhynchospora pubera TaxID=906938 RepID=A0AAV8CNH5_9POAL|nr:Zinc finger BED domain-containing protein DAYSLEEPER [Rhynchospora pubera]
MTTKFLKYWEEVPLVTIIANCLNPNLNKMYTVKMLQRYKSNLGLSSHNEEARVNFALETMFNIYNTRRNSAQPPPSSTTRPNTGSRRGLLDELRDEDDLITGYGISNELSSYTLLPPNMEDEPIDILDYWKRHSSAYPTLAMMVRDIFAVPVSTVPSESCFSSANRILTDRRSKLGPNVFERLVCMKDWIEAENRTQHYVPGETSGTETQPSASGSEVESEDEYDPKDTDLWYLRKKY